MIKNAMRSKDQVILDQIDYIMKKVERIEFCTKMVYQGIDIISMELKDRVPEDLSDLTKIALEPEIPHQGRILLRVRRNRISGRKYSKSTSLE